MKGQLIYEVAIEWERPIEGLDYVRESVGNAGTRQRPVPMDAWPGERVGYAVLSEEAPNVGRPGEFRRRLFWLKDHDRGKLPDGVYADRTPAEAVDPRTVKPKKPGELTDRARGLVTADG